MVFSDISVSLDGYVAGPDPTLEAPLGEGGERLHEWAFAASAWREAHGQEGGEAGQDADVVAETIAATGSVIMGRRMFSGGEDGWDDDPRARGWWGDDPPFHVPVFVLTHHARDPLEMEGGTTFHFVTEGPEAALEQALAAAGGKHVHVAGGGEAVRQFLQAGLLDTLQLHVPPVLLSGGTRLFEDVGARLEIDRVIASPAVTHLRYRVAA